MRDDIFHAIDAQRQSGNAYAVATVVETVGSVSAKTGSKAVIDHSGSRSARSARRPAGTVVTASQSSAPARWASTAWRRR